MVKARINLIKPLLSMLKKNHESVEFPESKTSLKPNITTIIKIC